MSNLLHTLLVARKTLDQCGARQPRDGVNCTPAIELLNAAIAEIQNKDNAFERRRILQFATVEYTCGCGLYVHPASPVYNIAAIHISDCPFA